MRNALHLSAVVLALSACLGSSPPIPADAAKRAAEETDILEATFRYQFVHNESSGTAQGTVDFLFLELPEGRDPPGDFLARFAGHSPLVEPVSKADISTGQVRHQRAEGRGLILRVTRLRWIDGDSVEVEGGYYEANRSASGNIYRVESRNGQWVVTGHSMLWIS